MQQLLQIESCGDDGFACTESGAHGLNFRRCGVGAATEHQRPDAGIDEERHRLERSDL